MFLIAKALAPFIPTLVIAYAVFGVFLGVAALFAHPVIVSAIYSGPHLLVQLLLTSLLAGWAIWVGIAVSTRSTDVRSAQQFECAGQLPAADHRRLDVTERDQRIDRPFGRTRRHTAGLRLARRIVASMFNRERLVTSRPA